MIEKKAMLLLRVIWDSKGGRPPIPLKQKSTESSSKGTRKPTLLFKSSVFQEAFPS